MTSKFKNLVTKYGPIAICTQIVVSLTWFGASYGIVKSGYDYQTIAVKIGLDPENEKLKQASDLTIAYILYKAMAPIRIPLVIGAVPIIARFLKYTPKI